MIEPEVKPECGVEIVSVTVSTGTWNGKIWDLRELDNRQICFLQVQQQKPENFELLVLVKSQTNFINLAIW